MDTLKRVIHLETRLERYKRIRREKRIRRLKFLAVLIVLSTMGYGLLVVNNTVKDFAIIENDNLIKLDIEKRTIDLLGKSYYIDLDIIRDVFN